MDALKMPEIAAPKHVRRHPLLNRNFAWLWSGQAISILGDFIFNTTLVVWVAVVLTKGQAWTPLAVSGIFLAASLPTLLLGALAGVFVDRWNKRLAMLWANLLQVSCVVLPLIQTSGAVGKQGLFWQLGTLYLVVFLVNTAEQVFRPAMLALIGEVVAKDEQAQAMGLGQISVSLATLLGPALAPPILLAFGIQWALLINMLSFLVSGLTILFIHPPQSTQGSARKEHAHFLVEFQAGARFLFHSRILRTMLVLSIIALLGGGALAALDIFFVTQNLHTPPVLYGTLETATGAGAILGAILASMLGERIGLIRMFWASVLALGVGILVYARLNSFVPALVLTFCLGIPFAALAVASGPLLLRATPQEFIGRIEALFGSFSAVATLLGSAAAGYIDSLLTGRFHPTLLGLTFGPIDTIFMAAGLLLLISGLYAMLSLRHADTSSGIPTKE